MSPLPKRGLYAITPELTAAKEHVKLVRNALEGGVCMVQFRDKSSDSRTKETNARALKQLCSEFTVPLIINDDVELALRVEADGVHIGRDDGTLAEARHRLGSERIIGVSCYNDPNLAMSAVAQGADYVAYGSFFPSPTKPQAVRATRDLVTQTRADIPVPLAAIGGITPDNAAALITAGVDLLAIISAIFNTPDPKSASRRFMPLF